MLIEKSWLQGLLAERKCTGPKKEKYRQLSCTELPEAHEFQERRSQEKGHKDGGLGVKDTTQNIET